MTVEPKNIDLSCPLPLDRYPRILLAHGGGGRLMRQLIDQIFLTVFDSPHLHRRHDAAVLPVTNGRIAFTTDSYVVRPLFFPGGDIGSLAVHGTVNDLAMAGAQPRYLSAGFILEEGLPTETLWRVVVSMQKAAEAAGIEIVTGDTKVVDNGKGDGIFINTAGIGMIGHSLEIAPASVRPGDQILLSGDLGRHGMAIMAAREGLAFEGPIESDSAPLSDLVQLLLSEKIEIHCLRDLTRGGLAAALHEIADVGGVTVQIEEKTIPVSEVVRGACEILGLDPIHIANEGRFVAFVPQRDAERALSLLRSHPVGREAALVGRVSERINTPVLLRTTIGSDRIIDLPAADPLPRIC